MSTAQDHKRLASLQDVFGPGAGSSITRFSNGVGTTSYTGAAGPQGSSGETGRAGSPVANAISAVTSLAAGKKGAEAANLGTSVLANENATLEELIDARDAGRTAQNALESAKKFGVFTGGAQTLGTVGTAMHGNLGNASSLTQAGIEAAVPYLGAANSFGNLISEKYNPIDKALQWIGSGVEHIPGVKEYVDPALVSAGQAIAGIPGMETGGTIAKNVSKFPDQIIKAPLTIYESLKNSKADEASARDAALTQLFTQEGSDGRLYISPPTSNEEVVGVDLPGNVNTVGVGSYSGRYNFPADEGKTRQQLYEEFQNSETYKGLISEKRGLQTLATQAKEDAAEAKEREVAISELTEPVQNIWGVEDYTDLNIGTHYRDDYGTYDAQTGEKLDVPSIYEPAAPILAPMQFEAPTAPEVEYQAPKSPTPVETAPTVRSDVLNPLKRVRPEELVAPRIMTPRRIRPQRETAPSLSRHEQDLANYKIAVEKESARKAGLYGGHFTSRPTTNYSKAQAADLLGFNAPLRTASQYMDLDARTKPKHNLQELTTGRNASSYRG